jgi:hypothetical protein
LTLQSCSSLSGLQRVLQGSVSAFEQNEGCHNSRGPSPRHKSFISAALPIDSRTRSPLQSQLCKMHLARLLALIQVAGAFAPPNQSLRRCATPRRAVDYDAELYRSAPLGAADGDLAEWIEKWARRAIIGEGAGGASVKLTTPVKLARRDSGARLLFTKSGSGYADKDKAKDDKWNDDSDDKPAPPKAGTGGVDVAADSGAIVATRCAYEGSGIVKQMSEEKIVSQLRKDVSAAFG